MLDDPLTVRYGLASALVFVALLLRDALAHSMNVPSLKVLDTIGFDAAISRASTLLGITDPAEIEMIFPRKYPLGLGVIKINPLQMARAFATFPNQGRLIEPIAIRYVEDPDFYVQGEDPDLEKIAAALIEPDAAARAQASRRVAERPVAYPLGSAGGDGGCCGKSSACER